MHGITGVTARRPLRRIGLSEDDRARGPQPGNRAGVGDGDMIREQGTAVGRAEAGGILSILDENRQAVERPEAFAARNGGFRRPRGRARLILGQRHHRIHRRIDCCDPGQARVQQFYRRQGFTDQEPGQFDGAEIT